MARTSPLGWRMQCRNLPLDPGLKWSAGGFRSVELPLTVGTDRTEESEKRGDLWIAAGPGPRQESWIPFPTAGLKRLVEAGLLGGWQ